MLEAERLFILLFRLVDAFNAAHDLSDAADHIALSCGCFTKNTVATYAVPMAQFRSVGKAEFGKRIGHMEFDRVDADAMTPRYLRICHAMTHRFQRAPFGRRQLAAIRWAATNFHHGAILAGIRLIYPTRTIVLRSAF